MMISDTADTKIKIFTNDLIRQLSVKIDPKAALAIADFDNASGEAVRLNLGFAVSEIIIEEFHRCGRFTILEKKQLKKIVETLALSQSGLFESDKIASIGKLINAQYLMVGSVSRLAGFYRISVRIVEIRGGSVIFSGSQELGADLLENAAEKYRPPRYRILMGSSMSWFGMDSTGQAYYSLGVTLGGHYNIAKNHWILAQVVYFFNHYFKYISHEISSSSTEIRMRHDLLNTFIVLAGYGYGIPLSGYVTLQPNISGGAVISGFQSDCSMKVNDSVTDSQAQLAKRYVSPVLQARADLIFMQKNPMSIYIGTGYYVYFNHLKHDYQGLQTDLFLNGIKLEIAVMFYL